MALDLSLPILVVDDYPTMIRIISRLLRQAGFDDIAEAEGGDAALAMIAEKKFGLVISDWNMEPMTGFELLTKMRADEAIRSTPFLMITADADAEKMITAKRAAASGFLVKPFNAETLKARIESAIAA